MSKVHHHKLADMEYFQFPMSLKANCEGIQIGEFKYWRKSPNPKISLSYFSCGLHP
jgi:hypothetical protein